MNSSISLALLHQQRRYINPIQDKRVDIDIFFTNYVQNLSMEMYKILVCKCVGVGEVVVVVVVLFGVFAQSYLFASTTKVCTLTNMLVDKL